MCTGKGLEKIVRLVNLEDQNNAVFGKIKMDTGDSQHIYSGEDSAGETKDRY